MRLLIALLWLAACISPLGYIAFVGLGHATMRLAEAPHVIAIGAMIGIALYPFVRELDRALKSPFHRWWR